jgi:hypothetical protein
MFRLVYSLYHYSLQGLDCFKFMSDRIFWLQLKLDLVFFIGTSWWMSNDDEQFSVEKISVKK